MLNLIGLASRPDERLEESKVQFYNLKTRSHVEVADGDIKKRKMIRKTKSGEQVRYAFTAEVGGNKLFKFVSEKDYKASKAPEVD